MVLFLGNLSAILPATRPKRNIGDILDIPTSATWKGESVSSRTSHERIVTSIIRFKYQKLPADHNLLYAGLYREENTEGLLFLSDFGMVFMIFSLIYYCINYQLAFELFSRKSRSCLLNLSGCVACIPWPVSSHNLKSTFSPVILEK